MQVLLLIHPIHLVKDSAQQAVSNQLKRRKPAVGDVMTGMTAQPKRRCSSTLTAAHKPVHLPSTSGLCHGCCDQLQCPHTALAALGNPSGQVWMFKAAAEGSQTQPWAFSRAAGAVCACRD